jgi:hypothetical protein
LADRDWLAEMHVTVPDADAFESAPPVEAEADPIPAPVTQMLAVPPAAGPIAGPVEAAASIGRCILIGVGRGRRVVRGDDSGLIKGG